MAKGQAPARPKIFGTSRDAPSRFSPNEFGAQKFRYQLLAKAGGMNGNGKVKASHAADFSP
jgi:hypothetical protein